jgi:RNA methyltransferase, TrmH family
MKPKSHLAIRRVTSSANSLLKVFRRALAEGATREGWLAVEGPHLVDEAMASGAEVRSVLVASAAARKFRDLLVRLPKETELVEIPDKLFLRVSATQTPQGLAALVELRSHNLEALLAAPNALVVVACGVQEPGNIGTMVRSARALGATALVAIKGTVSAFNPKATRASAGAIFRLPVVEGLEPAKLFGEMRRAGIRIIAADRRSPVSIAAADLRGPVAILIGREGTGLADEVAREAGQLVGIPLSPGTDSVNVATAAGICLYEAARQRGFRY